MAAARQRLCCSWAGFGSGCQTCYFLSISGSQLQCKRGSLILGRQTTEMGVGETRVLKKPKETFCPPIMVNGVIMDLPAVQIFGASQRAHGTHHNEVKRRPSVCPLQFKISSANGTNQSAQNTHQSATSNQHQCADWSVGWRQTSNQGKPPYPQRGKQDQSQLICHRLPLCCVSLEHTSTFLGCLKVRQLIG